MKIGPLGGRKMDAPACAARADACTSRHPVPSTMEATFSCKERTSFARDIGGKKTANSEERSKTSEVQCGNVLLKTGEIAELL